MIDRSKKRGVALVWVMIMSVILMIVSSAMTTAIIKETRMITNITDSTQAYAAAKSGIDWAKVFIDNECKPNYWNGQNYSTNLTIGVTTIALTITPTTQNMGSCNSNFAHGDILVESSGSSYGVNRKIEHKVRKNGFTTVDVDGVITDDNNLNATLDIDGSFTIQFDLWLKPGSTLTSNQRLGVTDNVSNAAYFEIMPSNQYRIAGKIAGTDFASSTATLTGIDTDSPYAMRVTLQYLNKSGIVAKVEKDQWPANVGYLCNGQVTYDLGSNSFTAAFTRFRFFDGTNAGWVRRSNLPGTDRTTYTVGNSDLVNFDNFAVDSGIVIP
jgi:hypothetical protein